MKTKLSLFFFMATILAVNVKGQNPYFPTKVGLVQVYVQKDGKGKVQNYSKQTIKDVEGEGNVTISYVTEILDKKRKSTNPPVEISYQVEIRDGVLIFDLKGMLGNMGQGGGEAKGIAIEIPSDLQPGQKLKDSEVKMQIGFIKASAAMTEGECLSIEEVTTEAGTFTCAKVSQMVNSSAIGIKTSGKQITWYAAGIGAVRTETYNKEKLQSVTELVQIED